MRFWKNRDWTNQMQFSQARVQRSVSLLEASAVRKIGVLSGTLLGRHGQPPAA
jgi:hypothetical protein